MRRPAPVDEQRPGPDNGGAVNEAPAVTPGPGNGTPRVSKPTTPGLPGRT